MESETRGFWVARFSRPLIFLIATLALIGGFEALKLPVAVFPSTDFPRIIIGVDNGVMPIDQMMVTITRPLEEAVNSVPGLQSVQSITSRGSAEIDLYFDWSVDMVTTLQLVDSALSRAQPDLPTTAKIESHRLTFASFPILGYSLTSNTVSPTELWDLATYTLKPRLNRLDGVASVLVQGGGVPEFQITPDPARMQLTQSTVGNLIGAVDSSNQIASPGLMPRDHQLFLGLVSGQVHDAAGLAGIVVKDSPQGLPIRIGDIAQVASGVEPVYTLVRADGQPAVLLSIDRQPQSNTLTVGNEVHDAMTAMQKSLPPGVALRPFYDQSTLVTDSISSVRDAILLGLILAAGIIVLFLRDWGASLVAGLVIPATLLITFAVMKLLGQSFNLMTLGGLAAAVGLVIDDAIVVVENIALHRDAGQPRLEAIRSALREVTVPLVGSTITPIVVFVPLISITGVTGMFFRALAVTVAVALITSLALALSWTPTLSQYFMRTERGAPGPHTAAAVDPNLSEAERLMALEEAALTGFFGRLVRRYEGWLRAALARPLLLAVACLLLVGAAWACYHAIGSDLLPAMDEGGFILDYVAPAGASLQETDQLLRHVEAILRGIPEVDTITRRTGLQLGLAAVTEANTGDFTVLLKRKRSRGIDDIIADARQRISSSEPQLDIDFAQQLQDMIGDLTGAPEPIQIKMFSPDGDLLNQWGPKVAAGITKVPGVVDVENGVDPAMSGPVFQFDVDPVAAAQAGFSVDEIKTDAAALLEGATAETPVVNGDHAYTVRVRYPDANRASLAAMRDTVLVSSSGHTATLGALATVTDLPGQTEIWREDLQRVIAVTARLEGRDLGSGVRDVQKAVAGMDLPPGIRVVYGGTYATQQQSFHDLLLVLVLAVVLVFIVLLFEFRNFAAPIAILASALLSTAGVFFGLMITRTDFNIASFMGLIMVIGIVAKNGILLLDADHKFRAAGLTPREAMVQAGRRRLRPIVMTALAAVAGMLPLAFAIGAGAQMLQPLAIAVIGGILLSMVLSLVITPAVYLGLAG